MNGELKDKESSVPAELQKQYEEDLKNNAEGIDVKFPKIKVDHRSVKFLIPDSSGGKLVDKITGVILHHQKINSLFDNETKEILCFSINGIEPIVMEGKTPKSTSCKNCSENKFGSGKGRSKNCKNVIMVYLMLKDQSIPHSFIIPPTSIKQYGIYISSLIAEKTPAIAVVTDFTLSKIEKSGFVWASVELKNVRNLSVDDWVKFRNIRDKYVSSMTPDEDSVTTDEAVSNPDDSEEDTPF